MAFSRARAGRSMSYFAKALMCSICAVCVVNAVEGQTAQPAQGQVPARPAYPTRSPHEPGYVTAKELPDGANAPADEDGNFILGPTHTAAPEMTDEMLQGTVVEFTMNSEDSKLYPGIAREPHTFGTPDPNDPAKLILTTFRAQRLRSLWERMESTGCCSRRSIT